MSTIYKESFVPIITHAAHIWVDDTVIRRKLISAHGCALIRVTKGYRTSTAALEVLANIRPILQEIYFEKLRYSIRRAL